MDKYKLFTPEQDEDMYDYGTYNMNDSLAAALGFCCCGCPEKLANDVAAYLKDLRQLVDSDRYYWAAMAADKLELTEHGGSVYGAWITPYGEEWLKKYEEWSSDK